MPAQSDLGVLARFDPADPDGADAVAIDQHRHAAFEHALQAGSAQEATRPWLIISS